MGTTLLAYPAWRSLCDSLQELAFLLRKAGRGEDSAAGALADQIDLLLLDPRAAADLLPADYRLTFHLSRTAPRADEDWDMEAELSGWLTDLTRQLADLPVLLEAPDAARALGQVLASELPRAWQTRLTLPLAHLRRMVRGAARGGLPAATPPAGAGLRLVVPEGEAWHLALPADAAPDLHRLADRELTYLVLREFGLDAARLHLALASAPSEGLTADKVRQALGLTGSRLAATERAYAALSQLRQVRLAVLTWSAEALERRCLPLWDVAVHEFGQACLDERTGALARHGADWAFVPRPGSWPAAPAAEAPRDALSFAIAALLSVADGSEVSLPVSQICALARTPQPTAGKLKAAARKQRLLGWEATLADDILTCRRQP